MRFLQWHKVSLKMVHPIWFEQMTFAESKRCSTAELRVHETGVKDGTRTRDIRYHKPTL
jgi:hypothetical protein